MTVALVIWQDLAACRDMNTDMFFPEADYLIDPRAISACQRCPVRELCLQWALDTSQEYGVWGGLTEDQRRFINTGRSRVRCPDCRSDRVVEEAHSEICAACGLSWPV